STSSSSDGLVEQGADAGHDPDQAMPFTGGHPEEDEVEIPDVVRGEDRRAARRDVLRAGNGDVPPHHLDSGQRDADDRAVQGIHGQRAYRRPEPARGSATSGGNGWLDWAGLRWPGRPG